MTNTPNLQLDLIPADRKVWADRMNTNLKLIDAAVGAYFTLNNLQGVWINSHDYTVDQTVVDGDTGTVWTAQIAHTSASLGTTFAEERAAHPTYWTVYSSPARARGAWTGPGTSYSVNDFVISGSKYAVCIVAHISGASFDLDEIDGKWSVLVDLSTAGSQVLPVPGGVADANKVVLTTPTGTGYSIYAMSMLLSLLGATTVGEAVFKAASANDARLAINAQVAGSYQAQDATLTALSGAPTDAFGVALLDLANLAALQTLLTLGTAAYLNVGTGANQIVQLTAASKIPAVDGSLLTDIPAATQTEQETGSSIVKAVTPGRQQYHLSAAKAWINFNGTGTPAILSSYNVSSLDDDGTGSFGINFTTAFSTANYAVSAMAGENTPASVPIVITRNAASASSVDIYVAGLAGPPFDSDRVSVICFGDL